MSKREGQTLSSKLSIELIKKYQEGLRLHRMTENSNFGQIPGTPYLIR
jgi:hypothetical protein